MSVSINTLDESFKGDMDNASSIKDRLQTLKTLHENGIHTILFMSPIFPYITDWKGLIDISKDYVCEYWFENLNLRGQYKEVILKYISEKYPEYFDEYYKIYKKGDKEYWKKLSLEIDDYCTSNGISFTNFFYHEELVLAKKNAKTVELDV